MEAPRIETLTVHRYRQRMAPAGDPKDLSLVIPVKDEVESLRPLYERIAATRWGPIDWELVLVDDGSRDGSAELMRELAAADPRVRAIVLAVNRGQTTATCAGVHAARGRLIATLDADLQNDPEDVPLLVAALGDADGIVGVRVERKDSFVRRASSRIANAVRNALTGDRISDTGCSLKVFRRDAILSIPWFEGMHRFLPTLMRFQGFRVVEHPVRHHPRERGTSKYGIWNRALPGLKDLFAVRWMKRRMIALVLPVEAERVVEIRPSGSAAGSARRAEPAGSERTTESPRSA